MFTFVETTVFARFLSDYLTDEEYTLLPLYLAENPESGSIVPKSGVYGNYVGVWQKAANGVDYV